MSSVSHRAAILAYAMILLWLVPIAAYAKAPHDAAVSAPRTLTGHQGEVLSLAFSKQGDTIASGGSDRTVRLWNSRNGRLRQILTGHTKKVQTVAFSPDGRRLASGGADRTCRIWDADTGRELRSFSIRFGNIRALAFSPDAKTLATAGDGGSLYLWDWHTGQTLKAMKSGFGIIYDVAFSPDGRYLATGQHDTLVHLWDAASGRRIRTFSGHTDAVHAVAFSPDGAFLASGSADHTVRLWEVSTGRERGVLTGHTKAVHDVAFTPDGKRVLSGGRDGQAHLWEFQTGQRQASWAEHQGPIHTLALHPDGRVFATAGRDRTVRIQPATRSTQIVSRGTPNAPAAAPHDDEVGPPPSPPPLPEATLTIHPHDIKPGDSLMLRVEVANTGKGPLYQFRATTESSTPLLNGKTLYFGKIPAGERRLETISIDIPSDYTTRASDVAVAFEEHNGFVPDTLRGEVMLTVTDHPRLAYNYQIVDDGSGRSVGNGDGRLQKGEAVDLRLTLRNVGTAPAPNTWVEVSNTEGQHLTIRPHMVRFGELAPDQSKQVRVNFTVWPDLPAEGITLKLFIQEKTHLVFLNEALHLPIDLSPGRAIMATNKLGTVTDPTATIFSGAGPETPVIASIQQHQTLVINGELGDWYRIKLDERETGWIAKRQISTDLMALKGDMPIPTIQGLEDAKTAQFITLSAKLQQAEQERAQIEKTLEQRESEVSTLRTKVHELTESHAEKLAQAQQESERERREREQAALALQQHEQELADLHAQLDTLANDRTSELSTMQEQLHAEQAQREQAEVALKQFRAEMSDLRSQLDEATTQRTPPVIAMPTALDGKEVKMERFQLAGAAASERGIARIEVRVNDELLVRRQGRGVAVVPGEPAAQPTMEFSETITLREGLNRVEVTAYDREQLSTTRTFSVTRLVDTGKIWAVVIGISQYDRVRPLKYADQDAIAFHDYLRHQIGVPEEQVSMLTNHDATLFNIKRTLGTELKRKAGAHDTVIIYYAGHGAPETDAMSPDGDGLEKYLIPYDADPEDLYATGLPMREVETIFRRLSAERVIFITDSCYSGATAGRTFSTAVRRATVSDNFLTRLSKGKGRVVLTASRAGEVSEERDELGHGVFTYYLLEGLRGKADFNADGLITVDEAYSYVAAEVPHVTGQNQHPVKKGEVEGELILGRVQ